MIKLQLRQTIINKVLLEKQIIDAAELKLMDEETKQAMLKQIQDSRKHQEVLNDLEYVIKLANLIIN